MIGSAVKEPPPNLSDSLAARSNKSGMKIEYVTRICLTSWWSSREVRKVYGMLLHVYSNRRIRQVRPRHSSIHSSPIAHPAVWSNIL